MSLSSKSGLKRTFPEGFGDSACVCVEHVFWAIPRVTKVKMKTGVFRPNIGPRMESGVDINPLESRLEQEWRMESAPGFLAAHLTIYSTHTGPNCQRGMASCRRMIQNHSPDCRNCATPGLGVQKTFT